MVMELMRDLDRENAWWLVIDDVVQSVVDLSDPTHLELPYVQWLACIIDQLPPGALDAAHIGGGACTLPRYLVAARPGSRQVVFEPNSTLIKLVSDRLALAEVPGLQVLPIDGVTGIERLESDSMDLVVLDAFQGVLMPPELVTRDFVRQISRPLRHDGVYVVNILDDGELEFAQRVLAAIADTFEHTLVITEPSESEEFRLHNVVVAASHVPLPTDAIGRRTATSPTPARCVAGPTLTAR